MLSSNAINYEKMLDKDVLIEKIRKNTVGIDLDYMLATGEKSRRIYLDNAASSLQLGFVHDIISKYMPYYSNPHTDAHFGSKISTKAFAWSHDMVLQFVGADPESYTAFFVGSGATAGLNRIVNTLKEKQPDREVVITSIMEHHSNDLPHRKQFKKVIHVPTKNCNGFKGCVDMEAIETALIQHEGSVNYISITGVSNVTGIINPIYEIAELAHKYNTLILVDASQMAPHVPIVMNNLENPNRNIDMLVFSGHKIYAPATPGVVVARKDLFDISIPVEVGGGMVDDVYTNRYIPTTAFPAREEAGTPNIPGAIALGAVLYTLQKIGMEYIKELEEEMLSETIKRLKKIDGVIIYGDTGPESSRRTGVISFNIRGMDHALTASILNDYFNISVRNACFCAHPYVRDLITTEELEEIADELSNEELEAIADLRRGMVRVSFGIYNTTNDVEALEYAIQRICQRKDFYSKQYNKTNDNDYSHKTFRFDAESFFSVPGEVSRWLSSQCD